MHLPVENPLQLHSDDPTVVVVAFLSLYLVWFLFIYRPVYLCSGWNPSCLKSFHSFGVLFLIRVVKYSSNFEPWSLIA